MFTDRRVSFVSERREFFIATPAEVRDVLLEKAGGLPDKLRTHLAQATSV